MYCMYKKGLVGSYDFKGVFFCFFFFFNGYGRGRALNKIDLFVKLPLVDNF